MKRLLMMIGAAAVAATGANAASVTIDSVTQRWPWNNKVDITYTVEGAQDIDRDVYAKIVFTATIGGTQYTIQGDTLGADASDGTHTVTWTPSVSTKDLECTMTATVSTAEVPSGNDFMIVDLSNGGVTYEGRYRTLTPSTNRYNTATYKTTKMVLRKIPRWSDRATLPNASALEALGGYPTGYPGVTRNPRRLWTPDRDYYLGLFPVTQNQYVTITGSNPSNSAQQTDKTGNTAAYRPVTGINWNNLRRPTDDTSNFSPTSSIPAVATDNTGNFFQILNYRTGLYFDLPTEIMHEIAGRAGSTNFYYWGESWSGDYSIASDNASSTIWETGSKLPNDWGFYDIFGNAFNWLRDYGGLSNTSSSPTSVFEIRYSGDGLSTSRRRIKGFAWNMAKSKSEGQSGQSNNIDPNQNAPVHIGFRVSLVVE